MKAVLLEFLSVSILGLALAFAVNAVSPKGLDLRRDYFRSRQTNALPAGDLNTAGVTPTSTNLHDAMLTRLKSKGLEVTTTEETLALFRDPRYGMGQIVFVDARDDDTYRQGHIPGAYQLDYYRPQNYLPQVIPAVTVAEKIVIYCNGGECEDSEFAALLLRDAGLPLDRLRVYAGGITQWTSNSLPVEIGARGSGTLKP